MLDRPIDEIAELAGIRLDRVREAGPLAEQALRGVASSIGHDEEDRTRLDDLLNRLEDAGHKDLADRMRYQRKQINKLDEQPRFSKLLPDERLRELHDRRFVGQIIDRISLVPTEGLFGGSAEAFGAELERRHRSAMERRIRELEEELRRLRSRRRQ